MTEPLYIHEKVLNMTQTKVTAFYIFHKLKIRPFFRPFFVCQTKFSDGDLSFKIIQEYSRTFRGIED